MQEFYHVNMTAESRNPVGSLCPLDTPVGVGFGTAQITKNGAVIFDEQNSLEIHRLREFEEQAQLEPDAD